MVTLLCLGVGAFLFLVAYALIARAFHLED
jgi:hypothetical protein